MATVTFSLEFDKDSIFFIKSAFKIDEQRMLDELKEKAIAVSKDLTTKFIDSCLQNMNVCQDVNVNVTKQPNDELKKDSDEEIMTSIMTSDVTENQDDNKIRLLDYDSSVTYFFAKREWQVKALNAIVNASKEGKKLTYVDILNACGISLSQRYKFRNKIGVFLRKSGVRVLKTNKNGCTVTEYFID